MKILAINLPNLDLSYFSKRGLNFEVTHINLDIQFPLRFLYKIEGAEMFTPDIHNYLDLNYTKYEYSFILYGYPQENYGDKLKSTGGYAHHSSIKSGIYWASVRKDGNENKYAVHEIHHLLCHYINITLKDISPKDFMDYTLVNGVWVNYYKNWSPEEPDPNHAQTWNNIIKFLPKLLSVKYDTLPVVYLKRGYGDDKQQLGDLIAPTYKCKTMELSWKDNKSNISCIPTGEYICEWTFSPKFLKKTYEVKNVPKRSGIRIHPANYFFALNGCIALGDSYGDLNKDRHADILNSTKTLKAFEQSMGYKPFKLIIQ